MSEPSITAETARAAEQIAGVTDSDAERAAMLETLAAQPRASCRSAVFKDGAVEESQLVRL